MAAPVIFGHRRFQFYQTNVTDEANTDAGAAWAAGESTLANSLKGKINSILAALRSAGIIAVTASNRTGSVWGAKAGRFLQTNIADVATANSDAVYDNAERDLLNEMKAKTNSIIAAMNAAGFGGANRHVYLGLLKPREQTTYSFQTGLITIADADGTYTSGGAGEQALTNDIKTKVNSILAALRAAKVLS
jgi:hypothetical protein